MRKPHKLMIHRADYYAAVYGDDAGAKSISFPTATHPQFACNFQEAGWKVVQLYSQRDQACAASCFTLESGVYDTAKPGDRVVFNTTNYRVIGKQDLSNLNRVYRIDLEAEVQ